MAGCSYVRSGEVGSGMEVVFIMFNAVCTRILSCGVGCRPVGSGSVGRGEVRR